MASQVRLADCYNFVSITVFQKFHRFPFKGRENLWNAVCFGRFIDFPSFNFWSFSLFLFLFIYLFENFCFRGVGSNFLLGRPNEGGLNYCPFWKDWKFFNSSIYILWSPTLEYIFLFLFLSGVSACQSFEKLRGTLRKVNSTQRRSFDCKYFEFLLIIEPK